MSEQMMAVANGRRYLLELADWLEEVAGAEVEVVEAPARQAAESLREIALAGDLGVELEDWWSRQGG